MSDIEWTASNARSFRNMYWLRKFDEDGSYPQVFPKNKRQRELSLSIAPSPSLTRMTFGNGNGNHLHPFLIAPNSRDAASSSSSSPPSSRSNNGMVGSQLVGFSTYLTHQPASGLVLLISPESSYISFTLTVFMETSDYTYCSYE